MGDFMISVALILFLTLISGVLSNSLSILAVSGIIVSLMVKFQNLLKRGYVFYIIFFILGIISFAFRDSLYVSLMSKGIIGYAFFLVVMFTGVFPNKWGLTRLLKKYRGELSVIGFISITPHALLHVFGLFDSIDLFGIASYVVMVPLTMISFKFVKREIELKDWLTIQKGAYLVYLLLFTHLMIVASWDNKVVYAVLLTLYINNKLVKEFKR